ncbi:hypothetical protein OSTOST_05926, partial [Ostertagia ostertagi]
MIICFYGVAEAAIWNAELNKALTMERTWIAKLFTPTCTTAVQESSALCDIPLTTAQLTEDEMFRLNRRLSLDDVHMLSYSKCSYRDRAGPWGWCDLPSEWNLRGNRKHRILIIGNSYATNQGRVVYEMCKRPDVEIKQFSIAGCEAFTTTNQFWHCHNSSIVYMNALKEFKPDVLFILVRYIRAIELTSSTDRMTIEKFVEEGIDVLKDFSKIVNDKIFVLQAIPRPQVLFDERYEALKQQIIDPDTVINKTIDIGFVRKVLDRTVKTCSKCAMIDYSPLFTINGTFQLFDSHTG